ncbi:unnamed protein product [Allacma fusca]|uniref:Uncharacterized protein n=1 Tax=Allacma fusca TaxID=39272 RepID=A0A8J2LKR7_9HEXA|nr:unnamed protein product [Allacma fusca]
MSLNTSGSSDDGNPVPEPRPEVSDGKDPGDSSAGSSNNSAEQRIAEVSITTAEMITVSANELNQMREFAMDEPTGVSGALRYCKRRILFPYLRLLGVMGLKPTLNPESTENGLCLIILNRVYFLLVVLLLLAGYVLQYLSCFRRDRGFLYKNENLERVPNDNQFRSICSGNPILIHVLPSVFHITSFLYMVYLYRFNDDEQLQNLMERVFIQATHSHSQFYSQKKLLRTLQHLVMSSLVWIITSTTCQLVQIWSAPHISFSNLPFSEDIQGVLIGTLALSTTWQDSIQVTVIISYCIHCILLSTYLELLNARVQQNTISLSECIKEIGELKKLISYLSDDLSPCLGPLLILDAATAVSSITFLALKGSHLHMYDFISLVIVATLWLLLFIFPITQAATLSASCKQVLEIGHLVRLRPFGYQDIPQTDLDSFLLFVSTLRMDVRILKMPISTPIIACSFSLIMFTTLMWGFFMSSFLATKSV